MLENIYAYRRFFAECKNEEERQLLRDKYLEGIYYMMSRIISEKYDKENTDGEDGRE